MTNRRLSRRLTMAVLALAVVACAPSACGEEGEADRIRVVIGDAQDAFGAGDFEGLCRLMTDGARRHIGGIGHDQPGAVSPTPCLDDIPVVYEGIRETRPSWSEDVDREVMSVAVNGKRATATVRYDGEATGAIPMAKENGEWRIDAFYGGMPGARQEDHF